MELININRLKELETVISSGMRTFVEVGKALQEIRDSRLYLNSHETFEGYCRDRWDMSRRHANRLIESTEVVNNLGPIGPISLCAESQARPLARLSPDQQREAWQRAVETAPDGKITASYVNKMVREIEGVEIKNKIKRIEKKIPMDEIVDEDFKNAFDAFYWEVQRVRLGSWKSTSKMAALKFVKLIKDLIEV